VLSVFENKVLRRTFEPKRDEMIAAERHLQNKELHYMNSFTV
jgi:hypothetical protein